MTRQVSDAEYGTLRRRLDEVARRVDQGSIAYDPTMSALQQIVEGEIPRPDFKRDMRKEAGWELVKDNREPAEVAVGDLELCGFLNFNEQSVAGEEMRRRAAQLGANLGQYHAEYLLDHQEEIPESWRGHWLIFPGTVWRNRGGGLGVPYLHWYGDRWILRFYWLFNSFYSSLRVVRSRKQRLISGILGTFGFLSPWILEKSPPPWAEGI